MKIFKIRDGPNFLRLVPVASNQNDLQCVYGGTIWFQKNNLHHYCLKLEQLEKSSTSISQKHQGVLNIDP